VGGAGWKVVVGATTFDPTLAKSEVQGSLRGSLGQETSKIVDHLARLERGFRDDETVPPKRRKTGTLNRIAIERHPAPVPSIAVEVQTHLVLEPGDVDSHHRSPIRLTDRVLQHEGRQVVCSQRPPDLELCG